MGEELVCFLHLFIRSKRGGLAVKNCRPRQNNRFYFSLFVLFSGPDGCYTLSIGWGNQPKALKGGHA